MSPLTVTADSTGAECLDAFVQAVDDMKQKEAPDRKWGDASKASRFAFSTLYWEALGNDQEGLLKPGIAERFSTTIDRCIELLQETMSDENTAGFVRRISSYRDRFLSSIIHTKSLDGMNTGILEDLRTMDREAV